MRTALTVFSDPLCRRHDPNQAGRQGADSGGRNHPERVERYDAVDAALNVAVNEGRAVQGGGVDVLPALLAQVHHAAYLRRVAQVCLGDGVLDEDTRVSRDSEAAARRAAGLGVAAVDAVVSGATAAAFVAARPPGHHARAATSSGFCVYNNVAIAAAAARAQGLERVAIVDFDVHHGDGTQDVFYGDPRTLFISSHQLPGWPGSGRATELGRASGLGTTLNCPLPPGTGDEEVVAFYRAVVPRVIEAFAPDIVLVSAGFDLMSGDPLGELEVSADGVGAITRALWHAAQGSAQGRVVAFLEGGYDLDNLRSGTNAVLDAFSAPGAFEGAELTRLGRADHRAAWRTAFTL